jgi:small subunit ribosomal protein S7
MTNTKLIKKQNKPTQLIQIMTLQIFNKFLNFVMLKGKKAIAESLLKKTFYLLRKNLVYKNYLKKNKGGNVYSFLVKVFYKVKPLVEVKSIRLGKKFHQVPFPVLTSRQQTLAFRELVTNSRCFNNGKQFSINLVTELCRTYNNTGFTYKRLLRIYKTAHFNKALAHYRWY